MLDFHCSNCGHRSSTLTCLCLAHKICPCKDDVSDTDKRIEIREVTALIVEEQLVDELSTSEGSYLNLQLNDCKYV